MKPIVQEVLTQENTSIMVKIVDASWFQTDLHQHVEFELILFTLGAGMAYIGEYEGKYEHGDIFFIGSKLPHLFKNNSNQPVSAVIVQFRDNFLGNQFMNIPECQPIKQLLKIATNGLQVTRNSQRNLESTIKSLTTAMGIYRVITLLQCLETMSTAKEYVILNKKKAQELIVDESDPIEKIIEFTQSTCHDPISLSQVAVLACMSVPSFCIYFKRRTHKTYINYLNEVRVSYACHQLVATNKPVTDIGYESGYNTVAHFHRQFLRLKKTTPLQYRKMQSDK